MPNDFYAKGTIKVKNEDGVLEPFLPKTDFSCVDDANGTSLTQIIANIETQIEAAENSGGIELMYEEATKANTADFSNETMIACLDSGVLMYTVDTEAAAAGGKVSSVPFNLKVPYQYSGQRNNVHLTVDWGDGTQSALQGPDNSFNLSDATHEYDEPGIYTITVKSKDWSNVYIYGMCDSPINNHNNSYYTDSNPAILFQKTLVEVNAPLPPIKGRSYTSPNSRLWHQDGNFSYLFCNCRYLSSIPKGLFDSIPSATTFYDAFYFCYKLESIPEGLFDKTAAVTSFNYVFSNCTQITSIPKGLFDSCTEATEFNGCFAGCSAIAAIPDGLFRYNAAMTTAQSCFSGCTSLTAIPPKLFAFNTNLAYLGSCFSSCSKIKDFKLIINSTKVNSYLTSFVANASDVTRIVCVPPNSTTASSFAAFANSSNNVLVRRTEFDCLQTLEFTVDTEAEQTGAVKASIPLRHSGSGGSILKIDWGDGTAAELAPEQITQENLEHTYASAGTYHIMAGTSNALEYEFIADSRPYSSNQLVQTFRNTVVSIDAAVPSFANEDLNWWFNECIHLETVSNRTFDQMPDALEAIGCFKGCTSLQSIPASLLKHQTELLDASSMFEGCSSIEMVSSGLLSQCRKLETADRMFKDCSSLVYYPETLLLNNTVLAGRNDMFSGCADANPTFHTKQELEAGGVYVELFDTEATEENGASIGIPYNLYGQSVTLTVDWGDGTSSSLTASDYASSAFGASTASVHSYGNAGLYFVAIRSSDWTSTKPLSSQYANSVFDLGTGGGNGPVCVGWRRFTLIEVATRLPSQFETMQYFESYSSYGVALKTEPNSATYFYASCKHLKSIPSDLFYSCPYIEKFDGCFCYCYSLQSIPEDLFASNPKAINFSSCFEDCRTLAAIPENLFANCPAAETFSSTFYGCSKIQSIPENLFANCPAALTFYACFELCGIRTIPSGLFSHNAAAEDFAMCFYYCSSLTSLPAGLFDSNTAVTTFRGCFWNCASLASIPSGLFDSCTAVTDFSYCFCQCKPLASIPSGLFDSCTEAVNFSECFYYDSNIASIPAGLFDSCTKATNFSDCFGRCGTITSIPEGLFDNNTLAISFNECFSTCSMLAAIPSGLFANCTSATTFNRCFEECRQLTSIPSNLFANCTSASSFSYCFYYCSSITSIPSGLFDSCTAATSFSSCFSQCSSLVSIPSGLFSRCTAATTFASCFYYCTSLTTIPANLFSGCIAAESFAQCFYYCTSLTSIQSGVFDGCTAATAFNQCFYYCSALASLPSGMFATNTAATNLSYCFCYCSSLNAFELHIGSSVVDNVSYFLNSSGSSRTVYVPAESATYTKFSAIASSYGLTVIGE